MQQPVNNGRAHHLGAARIERVRVTCPNCGKTQELVCTGLRPDVVVRCSCCRMVMARWGVIVEVAARNPATPGDADRAA